MKETKHTLMYGAIFLFIGIIKWEEMEANKFLYY
jgi:hypothetical protein